MVELILYMFLISVTPGPNTIKSMANAAEKGLRGITLNLGMLVGIFIVTNVAFFAISTLTNIIPSLTLPIQILGIIYLIYLGLKMLKKRGIGEEKSGTFTEGLLMQVMNVKVIMLAFTAISQYILPLNSSLFNKWLMSLLIPLMCFFTGLLWAIAGTALKKSYLKNIKLYNIIFSILLFILAFTNIIKIFL